MYFSSPFISNRRHMETFQLCLLILKCDILVYVKYYISRNCEFSYRFFTWIMTFFHSRNKFIKKTYDYSGGTNLAMKLIWPTVVNLYFCIKDISHILYTLLLISYIVGFFLIRKYWCQSHSNIHVHAEMISYKIMNFIIVIKFYFIYHFFLSYKYSIELLIL